MSASTRIQTRSLWSLATRAISRASDRSHARRVNASQKRTTSSSWRPRPNQPKTSKKLLIRQPRPSTRRSKAVRSTYRASRTASNWHHPRADHHSPRPTPPLVAAAVVKLNQMCD